MILMAFSLLVVISGLVVAVFDGHGYQICVSYFMWFIIGAVGLGFYSLIVGINR